MKQIDFRTMWFDTYERIPETVWRWPNFRPDEIRCKGDGTLLLDARAMDRLQALRVHMKMPLLLTSAYRSEWHNRRVGGAAFSLHRQGRAFDILTGNLDRSILVETARAVGFTGFGFYETFIHVDDGPQREWGEKPKG